MNQFVALSGGVDSTALALICQDAQLVFTDTGWEFDELYAHLDKIEQVTGREITRIRNEKHGSLPEYIRKQKYFPNHGARYCTRMFKIEPMNVFLKENMPAELLIGLRADEPDRTGNQTVIDGISIRYPLRDLGMDRMDCLELCLENDLLPRYPVYMARGGCKGCFYKRKSEIQAMDTLVPDVLDEIQELEEGIQDERGSYFHAFKNLGMSIAHLRSQPALFDLEQVYADVADGQDVGVACGLFCNR